jgi:hypothetical protein
MQWSKNTKDVRKRKRSNLDNRENKKKPSARGEKRELPPERDSESNSCSRRSKARSSALLH